jgi:hypothetical protein
MYDFELRVEGEKPHLIRVRRDSLDDARVAAEENAAECRMAMGAYLRHYSLTFVRALSLADS